MVDAEALAPAPLELVTPATPSARFLGLQRAGAKLGRIGLRHRRRCRGRARSPRCSNSARRESGIGVLGRFAGHRQAALDQDRERLVGKVGGGDGRRALADEQPQADLLAFRAADVFELAEAHLDARRAVADVERVGGGRAGGDAALDQRFGDSAGVVGGLAWRAA